MEPTDNNQIVLASGSPRRLQLMQDAGYEVEVVVPGIPEDVCSSDCPSVLVECLAFAKARYVAEHRTKGVVLGADTVAVLDDRVIGKPDDADHARRILRQISGATHQVLTGICLIDAATGLRVMGHDVTHITMKPMSQRDIEDYVTSGEGMGKAGAYAIQESGDRFVERLYGSFTNVVGLPMELVAVMLKQLERRLKNR